MKNNDKQFKPTGLFGRHRIYLLCTDSTNEYLKRLVRDKEVEVGTVVCAVQQSNGRGRGGRVWESPPGGLWFSMVLNQELSLPQTAFLSLVFALAVRQAISTFTRLPCQVKWPNDIYLDHRKVAGIFMETVGSPGEGKLIVGIGINVNTDIDAMSPEVRAKGVSMESYSYETLAIEDILETVLRAMEHYCQRFSREGSLVLLEEFKHHCIHMSKKVRVNRSNGSTAGICIDIDPEGTLLLDTGTGIEKIRTGDVDIL